MRGDLSAMVEIVYDYGVACHDGAVMMSAVCVGFSGIIIF